MVVEKWVGCWRSGDVLKWLSRYPDDIPWRNTLVDILLLRTLWYSLVHMRLMIYPCDIPLQYTLAIYPCDIPSHYTLAIPWWYGSVDILLLRTLWYTLSLYPFTIPSLIYFFWEPCDISSYYTFVDILLLRTLWYILTLYPRWYTSFENLVIYPFTIPSLIYFFWEPCDIPSHYTLVDILLLRTLWYTLSLYPFTIPSHYTLLIYPFTIPFHYTLSLYPFTIPSHYTLSLYPFTIPFHYTLSLYPFDILLLTTSYKIIEKWVICLSIGYYMVLDGYCVSSQCVYFFILFFLDGSLIDPLLLVLHLSSIFIYSYSLLLIFV